MLDPVAAAPLGLGVGEGAKPEGIRTVSMIWTTPFVLSTLAVKTFATVPAELTKVVVLPLITHVMVYPSRVV